MRVEFRMNRTHTDFGFYACVGGCVVAAIIELSMLVSAVI